VKTLWNVMGVLLLVHVLAGAALVGWLGMDGRLSRDRVQRAVEIFRLTLEEEQRQLEEEAALAKEMEEKIEHMAWLQQVSAGPQTMLDRLEAAQQTDEVTGVVYDRMKREIHDFQTLFANTEALLAAERAAIEAQRAALQEELERAAALRESEDFRQAKDLYEQLKPRQAKQMFQELMAQDKVEEVVDYLAAMPVRKAAAIIGEFKDPQEIPQGTMLLERLRQRGRELGERFSPEGDLST